MDNMVLIIIVVAIIMIAFLAIILVVNNRNNLKQQLFIKEALNQSEKQKNDDIDNFKNQITSDLVMFQNNLQNSFRGDLDKLNDTTVDRLVKMETKVNEGLMQGFEKTNKAFSSVLEQMTRIDETQKNLVSLSNNITSLQSILTDKKTRGTFGEVELYSLLESIFGPNDKRFEKQFKLSNGYIADSVIHAPKPLGDIVIDSKFPLENYNRLSDSTLSQAEILKAQQEFRKDVIKHIKDIHDKYIIEGETAQIAYMFIPAEAVFAEIYGHYDDIIQLSYNMHVYIVSPTTLMAYITAIKAIYLGQERNEKVQEIQEEFIKLSKEFIRFEDRYTTIVKDFDKTYKDLQSVTITSDKVIKRFKQIEAVDLVGENNVANDNRSIEE